MVTNNDVSRVPTHFINGIGIIEESRKLFNVPSENWAYPYVSYGDPKFSDFYAEIWTDGMDWNMVYWLLEKNSFETKNNAMPLLYFDNAAIVNKINKYDFAEILEALVYARKAKALGIEDYKRYYSDSVWAFLSWKKLSPFHFFNAHRMKLCKYGHASQPDVEFYVNNSILYNKEPETRGNEEYKGIDKLVDNI